MASNLDSSTRSGIAAGFDINSFEDSVPFTDALDDEPLFPSDWDQQKTPPYEGNLYSTPLNWDPPEQKIELLPPAPYTAMNVLTPAQQEKLRNIAMPHHLQYRGHHSPQSTASYKSNSISSPDDGNNRKRKSSASGDDEEDEDSLGQHPPVKKTAHNMIEKRYRTNLNDKIAALRDSVPSLRIMTKSARGEDTADDREELHGLTPAHKLNKATVLSKATEYINHLEKRNKRLTEENTEQKARLAAFETLFRSGSMGFHPQPPVTNPFQYPRDYVTPGPSPTVDPQGMIQVPEDIRRLHAQASQQRYQIPQEQYMRPGRQAIGPNGWQSGGSYIGKLMVGSLAGLMIMEGFSESEQSSDTPAGRGLAAVPIRLLRNLSQTLHSLLELKVAGYHISAARSLAYMKLFFVFGTLLYIFLPSVFASKSKSGTGKTQNTSLSAAPSLASSIRVRRQAWLTAIQTVWVPRHNFFLEAAALCLKIAKLSTRNFIGSDGYAYITGITQQQEAARVKAWEIALDAQLAGGDVEVSKSRLTLTLLASGTLPDTPARLMLKALHIRVLLWEVGNAGFNGFYMFHEMAAKLARWKWNEAKQLHRLTVNSKERIEGEFPEYFEALLEQECDDVLADSIGQRAYNLAWNLPTAQNADGPSDGMDEVVDDFAIRSPLDAVAAWYSCVVLQRALTKSLEKDSDTETKASILSDIDLCIKVAPVGSRSQIRALVARAVLVEDKRGANIAYSLQGLSPFESKDDGRNTPDLIITTSSIASLPDIRMSLRCAMAIAYLDRFPSPHNPVDAHRLINSIIPINLSLLGFTAAVHLMEKIHAHERVSMSCASSLERLAGNLRIWIGGPEGEMSGLDKAAKRDIVERCLIVTKRVIGMEKDAGYETMSEEDASEGC